jgi:hypothetical protein
MRAFLLLSTATFCVEVRTSPRDQSHDSRDKILLEELDTTIVFQSLQSKVGTRSVHKTVTF